MAVSEYDDATLFEIIKDYGFLCEKVGWYQARYGDGTRADLSKEAVKCAYDAIAERCRELRPVDIQILDGGIQLIADLDTSSYEDAKRWEESAGKGLVAVTGRL